MLARRNGREQECVVVDVNTQMDFCESGGAFAVANADTLIVGLRHVFAWIKRNQVPVVSSMESHRPFELSDSGQPIHCVDGSNGQRKLPFTLLSCRTRIEVDNTFSIPFDLFTTYQQLIFRKRTDDLLSNPKADRLLTQLPVKEFILFGTGFECSVKALALALLTRGKSVTVVSDACGFWSRARMDLAARQIAAKGATIISVDELLKRKLPRDHKYPLHGLDQNGKNGLGNSTDHKITLNQKSPPTRSRTIPAPRNVQSRRSAAG